MSIPTHAPVCPRLLGPFLGALGLLLASCASNGPVSNTGDSYRVVLHDYQGSQRFEIVSESYADPVEFASTAQRIASRKFLPDTVLEAYLDHLDDEGMDSYGQEGKAPRSGSQVLTRAFEVERNGRIRCWAVGQGTEKQEKLIFTTLMFDYVQMYTEIPSFQAIDNPEGHGLFRESVRLKTGR